MSREDTVEQNSMRRIASELKSKPVFRARAQSSVDSSTQFNTAVPGTANKGLLPGDLSVLNLAGEESLDNSTIPNISPSNIGMLNNKQHSAMDILQTYEEALPIASAKISDKSIKLPIIKGA